MYTWVAGDRLDVLAYKYYGDAQKWWVILDANPRYMTPWDIRTGDVISIPTYQEVRRTIGI
jgi:nucleoid-associated protein YgaU